jgi:Na+-translocating ferredoxin:NAD+ oxidoreductase RnfG subunit
VRGVFLLGGCFIRILEAVAIVAFVCLLAACSCQEKVPGYILQLAADGESIERMEEYEGDGITAVYAVGVKGKTPRMSAQESCAPGFNGMIKVLVLIDIPTGLIDRVHILEHHETDDYGGYVTEEWFLQRFAGKDAGTRLVLVKMAAESKEDIVAITGATYTSQAVVDAVNLCLKNYRKIIEGVEL